MSVRKLPQDIQSFLRSGINISDISQCVTELVLNSLDAGASRVGVRIDFSNYQLQVVDDGFGIKENDLSEVGKRYMTSKCYTLDDLEGNIKYYGFRGEALASIRKASKTVIIFTRPTGEKRTYCKILKPEDDECSKVTEANIARPGHGTTVVVNNFFGNMPVRQQRLQAAIEMEIIRTQLQAVALTHPQVSFSLRNDVTKTLLFHTNKCKDILENFQQIYELDVELLTVSAEEDFFKVTCYISRETAKTKQYQLVYVNKRFIRRTELHKFINKSLRRSFYLKNISADKESSSKKWVSVLDMEENRNNYAIFVVNIECPYSSYGCFDPSKQVIEFKSKSCLYSCIEKCVDKFLELEKDLHVVDDKIPEEEITEEVKESVIHDTIPKNELNYKIKEVGSNNKLKSNLVKELFTPKINVLPHRRHTAHSEHILTECDDKERSPFGVSNFITLMENNKRSIIPVMFKDFYEANLDALNSFIQLKNRVRNFTSKITPNGKIKNVHISIKKVRESRRKIRVQKPYTPKKQKTKSISENKDEAKRKSEKRVQKMFTSNDFISGSNIQRRKNESKEASKQLKEISVQTDFNEFYNPNENNSQFNRISQMVPSIEKKRFEINQMELTPTSRQFDAVSVNSFVFLKNLKASYNHKIVVHSPKLKLNKDKSQRNSSWRKTVIDVNEEVKTLQSKIVNLKLDEMSDICTLSNERPSDSSLICNSNSDVEFGKLSSDIVKRNESFNQTKQVKEKNIGSLFNLSVTYVASKERRRKDVLNNEKPTGYKAEKECIYEGSKSMDVSSNEISEETLNLSEVQTLAECLQVQSHEKRKRSETSDSNKRTKVETSQAKEAVVCQESNWKKHILPGGKNIYVQETTGMSSYLSPKEEKEYGVKSRQWFWPKGISPIHESVKTDGLLLNLTPEEKKELLDFIEENKCDSLLVKWREYPGKDLFNLSDFDPKESYNAKGVRCALSDLQSCKFSSEDLQKINVIGLVDKKFIAARIQCDDKDMIVLFDQHAVDERIRYESLYNDYKCKDGSFFSSAINPPLVLEYSKNKHDLLKDFVKNFEGVGLALEVTENRVMVHGVPMCLIIRCEKEALDQTHVLLTEVVKKLITECVDVILTTRGSSVSSSQVLDSLISYEACRGAIKFGDTITTDTARAMIRSLSNCKFPFQCAHGRPVLSPVFNLSNV